MTKAKRRSSSLVELSADHKKVKAVAAAASRADLRLVDLVMDLLAVHLMADKHVVVGAAAPAVVVEAPAAVVVVAKPAAVKCANE